MPILQFKKNLKHTELIRVEQLLSDVHISEKLLLLKSIVTYLELK